MGAREVRRGLSILEVALAFAILGLAVVPILNLFFGTSRLAKATGNAFRDALAGQLVWESIKARNAMNPAFLRDLTPLLQFEEKTIPHPHRPSSLVRALVHTGAFVASMGPVDARGRPLDVSPFAMYLFNRAGGELYAADNKYSLDTRGPSAVVSTAEVESLHKNFQDLAVRVTVVDALLPDWKPGDPANKPLVSNEQLKDVFVEVFHAGPDHRLPARPTFTLESSIQTPTVSLSQAGVQKLRRNTDDYDYGREIRAAVAAVRAGLGDSPMGSSMKRVAGDMVLISIESVGECVLAQGHDLSFGIENGDTGKGSNYYSNKLEGLDSPVAKITAADLEAEEAKGIFRAFRRSRRSIEVLNDYGDWFGPRLRAVVRALARNDTVFTNTSDDARRQRARDRIRELATGYRSTLTQLGFWTTVLGQERWWNALRHPVHYISRYTRALDHAQTLYRAAEAHPQATPMDRVRAISGFLEVTKAKKLFEDRALEADERWLRERADALAGILLPFSEMLRRDEVHDLAQLAARNELYRETLVDLKRMLSPGGEYERTLELLKPRGLLLGYRRRLNEVFDRYNLPEFNGELNQEIGELVEQVRDADFPAVGVPPNEALGPNTNLPTDGDETDDPR